MQNVVVLPGVERFLDLDLHHVGPPDLADGGGGSFLPFTHGPTGDLVILLPAGEEGRKPVVLRVEPSTKSMMFVS